MKKYETGGNVTEDYRKQRQEAFAARKAEQEAKRQAKAEQAAAMKKARDEKVAKEEYDAYANKYEREMMRIKPGSFDESATKFMDNVGDKLRGLGKSLGVNNMTSRDDEARMKARKDIKGYKKGGMVKSSASARADGCAIKGKTKGRMV